MKYKNLNEVQYLDFEEDIYSDSVPGSNLIFLLFLIFDILQQHIPNKLTN